MLGSRVKRASARPVAATPRKAGARPAQRAERRTPRSRGVRKSPTTEAWRAGAARPLALLIVMVICSGALTSRLVFWQVMQHGRLTTMAAAEHAALYVKSPVRGEILDAHGNPLATDVTMDLVYAAPKEIKDPARTAALLAPILGRPEKQLEQMVTGDAGDPAGVVLLDARADATTSRKVRDLALPGIILDPAIRRYYPEGQVAAQILGYVTNDNTGYWGLEGYYNGLLAGKAGLRSVLRDTAGNDIHIVASGTPTPEYDGAVLHLSIDGVVQGLIEDELQKAVKQHSADGGTIIVMDPRTGYVLGMANHPSFDPNHYTKASPTSYANPAVSWTYEPGSTFKIITMAAGLDTHVITPQTSFFDTGQFVIGDATIHNWNLSGFGQETMTQVLQHSANVGAAFVSQRLGTDRFYRYVRGFRFGQATGVDLQGEQTGILPLPGDRTWTIVNQYTNAFGQGIGVTPIQMIRAVAAVANGGVMLKPRIVKQIDYDGRIFDHSPVSQGRVVSAQTAHTLTDMLVHSAIGGEASLGLVKGYNIAAKTGTASIAGPDGRYIQGATIASIVGYAPAYNPRFVVLVIINHPRDTPWGSMAAAPVLHNLFQELFMYYRIPPQPHALYR